MYDEDISISFNNIINNVSGNKFTVEGILINNEVYYFPDIGTQGINKPGPSRRPASSQSPLIVLINGKTSILTGYAGFFTIYIHTVRKIISILNEIKLSNTPDINVGIINKYVPVYSSFGFIVTNKLLQKSILDIILTNNNNNYFSGAFQYLIGTSNTIYINNNIMFAMNEGLTYNQEDFNYQPFSSEVVNKL